MLRFVIRRLFHAALTVFGVMLLTFVLFTLAAGDIAAQYSPPHRGEEGREEWRDKHGLNDPVMEQFARHLWDSVTFQGRSYATDEKLTDIIVTRAPFSLALTVPGLVIGWTMGMVISCFVAYYRDTWVDRVGVFLSVLGMCIPFLGYMILGQWLVFHLYPPAAWGLANRANIYLPIGIAVIAGLGATVRFYRTIILDQVNQDYVRTARAKGTPLTTILFKHVIRNCMLPILTQLVMAVPMLIMGSLLLEKFFGIPGLGDLLISSVGSRDVPIVTGLTFLTAVIYVVGLLVTDLLYAVFDPRIRLR